MCDLMTGMMIASTAVSAGGGLMSAGAEAKSMRAAANTADFNATLLNARINDSIRLADDEERVAGAEAAYHIGGQRVAGAAGNLDLNFGSPLQALLASAEAASRDAGRRRDNTMRDIRDVRTEQANLRSEARSLRAGAKGVKRAGYINAVSSVLGGASSMGSYRAQHGLTRDFKIGRAKVKF